MTKELTEEQKKMCQRLIERYDIKELSAKNIVILTNIKFKDFNSVINIIDKIFDDKAGLLLHNCNVARQNLAKHQKDLEKLKNDGKINDTVYKYQINGLRQSYNKIINKEEKKSWPTHSEFFMAIDRIANPSLYV